MYFKQFYLGCLAHASYLIGDGGKAAVVDPRRDVDIYLEEAGQQGLKITHVIETHLHADFVSGHRELAGLTGAEICFGPNAGVLFGHLTVREGDGLSLGNVVLRFLETPGHTPESISILVYDKAVSAEEPEAVLTGDTLFIGDVGRPDLLGSRLGAGELAAMLYDSLHSKLMTLPDHVKVFPAHGAGSLCGRNISSDNSSTIGRERLYNYALQPMTKQEFVTMMTVDLPEAPPYFRLDVEINRSGPSSLAHLREPPALPPEEVARQIGLGFVLLDTRSTAEYGTAHIPGSLNIGLSGRFAGWAGTLIPAGTPILLVAESGDAVHEARVRLARVGLENVAGCLRGGILAWCEAGRQLSRTEQISVDELHYRLSNGKALRVLDVRRAAEWQAGRIAGATHIPLHTLPRRLNGLPREEPIAVICAGGYRSSIATSLLERHGCTCISNVIGGMGAWSAAYGRP